MTRTEATPPEFPEIDEQQLRQEIEADLEDIPYREPIVDTHDPKVYDWRSGEDRHERTARIASHETAIQAHSESIERRWQALTEAARRAINASPEVRRTAATFTGKPLSELLPNVAMSELVAKDERLRRSAALVGKTLFPFLALEAVPDTAIQPDLRNAPRLFRKHEEVDSLLELRRESHNDYLDKVAFTRDNFADQRGLTQAERGLVARRYRYARDVKLLGLMAELHDQPPKTQEIKDGMLRHELPSGTRLALTAEMFEVNPALLDPQTWKSRKQLKDRVYEITVESDRGDQKYILKERKTNRHVDGQERGHRDGLTSRQEFETAQEFADLGTIKQGDIELRWEKPLGYIEFPDGFQCCLFEYEPDLKTESPRRQLANIISKLPEAYADEFQQVQQMAKELYERRPDIVGGLPDPDTITQPKRLAFSKTAREQRKTFKRQPAPDELTFDEFAELKAYHMIDDATTLLRRTMHELGYANDDFNGYAFAINKDERATLEIIGFDFEYYVKNPKRSQWLIEDARANNEDGPSARMNVYRVAGRRNIMHVASYGMMEARGIKMPPFATKN